MKRKHVHKYKRVKLPYTENFVVFKCQIPGCTTYKPRNLVIGEESICWKCNESLILDSENTYMQKPTHKYCRKVKIQEAA